MRKKIIALAVSAASVAALSVGSVAGPAKAAEVPPGSIVNAVCQALPSQVTGLLSQLGLAGTAVTTAQSDLTTKQAALATSINDLVTAVVAHITTINNGGNVDASGQVLMAKNSIFADKVVAENNAMTTWFEAQRNAYLTGLTSGYVGGVQSALCI
jgi:hypothetical protein